MNTYTFQKGSS